MLYKKNENLFIAVLILMIMGMVGNQSVYAQEKGSISGYVQDEMMKVILILIQMLLSCYGTVI